MADTQTLLRRLRLDRTLAAHDPALVGARGLGLTGEGPVVILCRSGRGFSDRLTAVYGESTGFTLLSDDEREGCTFTLLGTPVQIIGRPRAVRSQVAFRTFQLQVRLLRFLGAPLREVLARCTASGLRIDAAFGEAMGTADLLTLERTPPHGLRLLFAEARRPAPAPAVVAPEPEPEVSEETEEGDELLRQPDPLLKERRVTWLDAARLLPVSRQDLPAPKRKPSQQQPRLPKKP